MEFMGTKEASEKWGVNSSTITRWCRDGRIEGAEQDAKGSPWRIPINVQCPTNKKLKKKS